jgi:hypothetical protein
MKNRTRILMAAIVGAGLMAAPLCSLAGSANSTGLTPEKLVAEHIKSLGGADLLSAVHTHAFVGSSDVDFIQGMSGSIKGGSAMIAADGKKTAIVLKFGSVDYPQEYFSFNGEDVSVGYIAPGQRSPLADFIFRFPGIMKKGFLGGTLSLGWPLLDKDGDFGKLKFSVEKVEGKELYQLEWPKSTLGNVRIRMFFEPETFRHVRTEYDVRIKGDVSVQSESQYLGSMGETSEDSDTPGFSNIMRKDMLPDSIYRLVEKFEDYKKVSGMMLPHKYSLEYSLEGQGHSFIGNWTINATKFVFNNKLDPKIFEAQK